MTQRNRWLLPLMIGLVSPLALYSLRRHYALDDHTVRISRVLGVDPRELQFVWNIEAELGKNAKVSARDWRHIVILTQSSNVEMSYQALTAMSLVPRSQHGAEEIAIMRKFVTAPDGYRRTTAVVTLRRLQAPDWRAVAQGMTNDPDPQTRKYVAQLLARPDRSGGNGQ